MHHSTPPRSPEHASLNEVDWTGLVAVARHAADHPAAILLAAVLTHGTDTDAAFDALTDPRVPADALTALVTDVDPVSATSMRLAIAAAAHPAQPAPTLASLLQPPTPHPVSIAAMSNPSLTADLLDTVAAHATLDVQRMIARHPAATTTLLDVLATHHLDSDIRDAILAHPNTHPDTLARLVGPRPDLLTIHAAARNANLEPATLTAWAAHPRPSVRRVSATNPALPEPLMDDLAWSGDDRIQVSIAAHPAISSDVAAQLASASLPRTTRLTLAQNPAAPLSAVLTLLVDPDPAVRAAFTAARPDLPGHLLTQIAADDDSAAVRRAIAAHPNTPARTTVHLLTSAKPQQRRRLAVSLATRTAPLHGPEIDLLDQLQLTPQLYARPECPAHLVVAAATGDRGTAAIGYALAHPQCPAQALNAAGTHPDPTIRLIAATLTAQPMV